MAKQDFFGHDVEIQNETFWEDKPKVSARSKFKMPPMGFSGFNFLKGTPVLIGIFAAFFAMPFLMWVFAVWVFIGVRYGLGSRPCHKTRERLF